MSFPVARVATLAAGPQQCSPNSRSRFPVDPRSGSTNLQPGAKGSQAQGRTKGRVSGPGDEPESFRKMLAFRHQYAVDSASVNYQS